MKRYLLVVMLALVSFQAQAQQGQPQQGQPSQGENQDQQGAQGGGAGDQPGDAGNEDAAAGSQSASQENSPDGTGEGEFASVYAPRRIGGEGGPEGSAGFLEVPHPVQAPP